MAGRRPFGRIGRAGFAALGCVMLVLAFIGALLPLMPTTIFLILAAWCFGRSSPRLEAWMLQHPKFGPALRAWREHGAVPRHAKYLAAGGMAAGFGLFVFTANPAFWLAAVVAATLLAISAYIWTRPDAEMRAGPTE